MGNNFGFSQRFETKLGLRVDPRVVLSSKILELTQQELQQAIDTELNENPALERIHDEAEPIDERTILRSVAPYELKPSSEDFEFRRSLPSDEGSVDWVELAASRPTLWDHLRGQLLATLPKRLHSVALYMIECVNARGYLTSSLEDIALASCSPLEDAERVLSHLRRCEPAGVGAYNLQECLMLQLGRGEQMEDKLARAIIKSHLDDFLARKTLRIARKYKVMPTVVDEAFGRILMLDPYPGEQFASHVDELGRGGGIVPDLILIRDENGWHVEVKGADPSDLTISREYRRRFEALSQDRLAAKDEKRHIATFVQRASDFINSVAQRKKTLRSIGAYLAQNQAGFLSTGNYQFLQPLTRVKMAADLGVHESTISRATQDKFVQIGNGEVVSFDVFFKPALRIQKMIEEILATENPDNPLSDERIAQLLAEKGVEVARRTVNKYRDRTRMLSSRKRRSA